MTEPRRASEMDRRMTTMEVQLLNMGRRMDEHIVQSSLSDERTAVAIAHLDHRQDRSDIFTARLIGGLLVAQFLVILIAPAVRTAIGLS